MLNDVEIRALGGPGEDIDAAWKICVLVIKYKTIYMCKQKAPKARSVINKIEQIARKV